MQRLSIVVPVLDEAGTIVSSLEALAPLRGAGVEVLVVDGGSRDATRTLAGPLADRLLDAPRGRASQMNAGAAAASGDWLLFLHADTRLPAGAAALVGAAAERGALWGRFDVRIDVRIDVGFAGRSPLLSLVALAMNLRSRLTGIATGDQAIFVRRDVFARIGGFPEIALMEDIVLSRRLRALASPACLRPKATTSGRRWEKGGVLRVVLTMWWLRLRFFFGADPDRLARAYGYAPCRATSRRETDGDSLKARGSR